MQYPYNTHNRGSLQYANVKDERHPEKKKENYYPSSK